MSDIITLRRHALTPEVRAFFSDYESLTFDNPIDPRERVWSYADDAGERMPIILTALSFTPHHAAPVWLKTISSPEGRGKGQASYVLREVTRLADKHGVAIWLTPKPFGRLDNSLKMSDLKAWYTRHGWVPRDGGVWVRQPITSRVATRWFRTASNACNPVGVSYAWIDPNGKVHPTPHGHESWGITYILGVPSLRDDYKASGASATHTLLKMGWIRFANFTNINVWSDRTPSPAAWRATAELVVGCAVSNRTVDVFEPLIYLEEDDGLAEVYSVSDFVERYADRRLSDRMFDMLMERQ
ncbi:MAG: hypothetical protein EBT79_02195 [Actinobacteria bacterium]|nr:hypothetical protein [Actinomycetota bacterium]NBR66085.1 hypothetical protein [Actinomycetota bacterium]